MAAIAPAHRTGGVAQAAPNRAPRRRSPALRKAFPYLLVAPALLYLMAITLYPGAFAIYQSLFVVTFKGWDWAGIDNYTRLLGDREFWAALGNTAVIGGGSFLLPTGISMTMGSFFFRCSVLQS